MKKKDDDMARAEEIEATRAQETWDGEGGAGAPRPVEAGAVESTPRHVSSPSRGRGPASRRPAQVAETPLALEMKHSQVDLREVTLHWTEVGRGPPVLLLHGLNDSHRTWRAIYPRLPGRRILMLDLPGHGMSSRPDAPYTLDWNATQLARFIEHLDLRNLDLVGHSYGGGVAQWLLLKCRPRIRRVALLAAGGLGRDVYPWLRLASVPFLIEAFGQRWMGPIAGFAMARATTSDAAAELALLTTYLRQPGSARAFSRTVRDVIRWRGQTRNLFDRIAEIEELPPMRLFWGARDTILPISQGTAIAARLENCELIPFADRGHFLHWEEPEGVAGALRNFLDSLDAPPVRVKPHATRSSISGREIAPPRRFRLGAIERRRRLASDSPDARRATTSSASRLGQCHHPELAPHGLLARIKNITGR